MRIHVFIVIVGIAGVHCRPNSISDNVDIADANSVVNGTLVKNEDNFETTTAVSTDTKDGEIQEPKDDVKGKKTNIKLCTTFSDAAKIPEMPSENKTNLEQANDQTEMKVLSLKDAEPSIDDITTSKDNTIETDNTKEKLVIKEIEKVDKPDEVLKTNDDQTKEQSVADKIESSANTEATVNGNTTEDSEKLIDIRENTPEPNKTNVDQIQEPMVTAKTVPSVNAEAGITTEKSEKLIENTREKSSEPNKTKEQTVTDKTIPGNAAATVAGKTEKAAVTINTAEKIDVAKILQKENEKLKHIKEDIARKLKKLDKTKNIADNTIPSLKEEFLSAVADRIHNIKVVNHGGRPRIVPADDKPKKLRLNYLAQNIKYSPVSSHFANIQMIANRYKHLPSTGPKLESFRSGNAHKSHLQHALAELEKKLQNNTNDKDEDTKKILENKGLEHVAKIKKIVSDVDIMSRNHSVKEEILPQNKKELENKITLNDTTVASNSPVTIANADNVTVSSTTEVVLTEEKTAINKNDAKNATDRKKISYDEIKHADGYSTFIATKNKSDEAKSLKDAQIADVKEAKENTTVESIKNTNTTNISDVDSISKTETTENNGETKELSSHIESKEGVKSETNQTEEINTKLNKETNNEEVTSKTDAINKTTEDLTLKSELEEPTTSKPRETILPIPKPESEETTTVKSLETTPETETEIKETTNETVELKSVATETTESAILPDTAKEHTEPIYNRDMTITPIDKSETPIDKAETNDGKSLEIISKEVTTSESKEKDRADASTERSVESVEGIDLALPDGSSDIDFGAVPAPLARLA